MKVSWNEMKTSGKQTSISALVVIVVAAASFVAGARPAEAAYPGGNGKIAFISNRDGSNDIRTMNPDGSGATKLTNDGGVDSAPVWSPDGQRLVYQGVDDRIWVINADGTGAMELTPTGCEAGPTWSPDGQRIAFYGDLDHACESSDLAIDIWVMNADGTGATRLTGGVPAQESYSDPAWSPDGQKIAFHADAFIGTGADGGYGQLYTMNPDGSEVTQLTFHNHLQDPDPIYPQYPSWSPDGSRIAFDAEDSPADPGSTDAEQIWVVNADGSGKTRLTDNQAPTFYDLAAWSPDGQRIAFQCQFDQGVPGPTTDAEICTMNADGSGLVQLTDNSAYDGQPNWQPLPDLVVTDCNDPSLAQVTSVQGNLIVENLDDCTSLSLPNLTHVGGDISITGDTSATTIDLGSLSSVGGHITITGDTSAIDIDLGLLISVSGDVTITGDTSARGLDLGSLTAAGNVTVSGDTSATTISLGSLSSAGSVEVSGDSSATTIDLGSLSSSGDVTVTGDTSSSTIDLGSLGTAGDVNISGDTSSSTISLGSLQTAGDVTVSGDTSAQAIDLGSLSSTSANTSGSTTGLGSLSAIFGNITIRGDTSVTTVNLASLTTAGGTVDVSNDGSACTVSLGSLGSVTGSLRLGCPATTLGDLSTSGLLVLDRVTLSVGGDFSQSSSGKLTNIITGDSTFGAVAATGNVSLDGSLAIAKSSTYHPLVGVSAQILSGSAVTGAFSRITGVRTGTASNVFYVVHYDPADVTLVVTTTAIHLTPRSGAPGSTFTVAGSGFTPGETVVLRLGTTMLTPATADSTGGFSQLETVPAVSAGKYRAAATGQESFVSPPTKPFTVTG